MLKLVKILVHKDLVNSFRFHQFPILLFHGSQGRILTDLAAIHGTKSFGNIGEHPEVNILRNRHPSNRPWHKAPSTPPKEALGSAPAVLPWRNTKSDFGNDPQSVE